MAYFLEIKVRLHDEAFKILKMPNFCIGNWKMEQGHQVLKLKSSVVQFLGKKLSIIVSVSQKCLQFSSKQHSIPLFHSSCLPLTLSYFIYFHHSKSNSNFHGKGKTQKKGVIVTASCILTWGQERKPHREVKITEKCRTILHCYYLTHTRNLFLF